MKKKGKVYKYQSLEFYAADGLICIIDTRDEDPIANMEVCRPGEFIKRAIAVHFKWSQNKKPDEFRETEKLMEDAVACAKEAQKQAAEMIYVASEKQNKILVPRVYTDVKNFEAYYQMTPEEAKFRLLQLIKRDNPEEVLKKGLS